MPAGLREASRFFRPAEKPANKSLAAQSFLTDIIIDSSVNLT